MITQDMITVQVHATREKKWGTARFSIWHTPAFRPTYSNLDWPTAWLLLTKEPTMRGKIETTLRAALAEYDSEVS